MNPLVDRFGRIIEYLRLSVTDRCDLRCAYCIPEGFKDFEEPDHWLTFDELERLLGLFAGLGMKRVRLTGGEPLLRRNVVGLCGRIAALPGIDDLSLSSNATQLARMADDLKRAGVTRLNISLDSLRPEIVEKINGRPVLDKVLDGLEAARSVGFAPIKVNMVVMRENADDIDAMVAFCMERGFVLRLIELMPMGDTARRMGYVDLQPVIARLRQRFGLVDTLMHGGGPARYLGTPDGRFTVGFITPISQHFCETCNRVRLTVDGVLHLCLGQEERMDFRVLMRAGASDADLADAIHRAIDLKPERHEFREQPQKLVRFMSMTGG
ncbi:MAG: GTP 3',8-cyclase MoaA [Hydrogenophilales bacterium CG17_big_fil_post_rev_8_21_14_2_50_63_12]|nr:MAG: GTP 3',8-cyclase MoaA [Hydrogenophilales bacterium CG17_big_fil_post_rev_8_21_14_2_50_63_12]PIX96137.1 MAG: GTP 3',8-cyclase MoaA [Hydrogenophilales bacterium CG_4_10_14_3_um_filter_63_21]PJB04602.1 MAG: GTP 3',8-cyclase MoaA [Hydrogenophilales bacterium CG_4_9_14_3_um_filter_63_34]